MAVNDDYISKIDSSLEKCEWQYDFCTGFAEIYLVDKYIGRVYLKTFPNQVGISLGQIRMLCLGYGQREFHLPDIAANNEMIRCFRKVFKEKYNLDLIA